MAAACGRPGLRAGATAGPGGLPLCPPESESCPLRGPAVWAPAPSSLPARPQYSETVARCPALRAAGPVSGTRTASRPRLRAPGFLSTSLQGQLPRPPRVLRPVLSIPRSSKAGGARGAGQVAVTGPGPGLRLQSPPGNLGAVRGSAGRAPRSASRPPSLQPGLPQGCSPGRAGALLRTRRRGSVKQPAEGSPPLHPPAPVASPPRASSPLWRDVLSPLEVTGSSPLPGVEVD